MPVNFTQDNYSIFHNYSYQDKSLIVKGLDVASSPIRNLFGFNVDLINERHEEPSKKPLILTIVTIALATFMSPTFGCLVAAVPLAALIVKACVMKFEKERINMQFEKIKLTKEFQGALSDSKKIELFRTNLILQNEVRNQREFADAVANQYEINRISLNGVIQNLSLISDKKVISDTIVRILGLTLQSHKAPYTLSEFNQLINDSLKDEEEVKACYLKILESHKIENEINMSMASVWRLKQVLLIEDVVSSLEYLQVKDVRESAFTTVQNYNQFERENIRSFLHTMGSLKKENDNLIKSVQDNETSDFRNAFDNLIEIAKTMKFPKHEKLSELKVEMTNLLIEKKYGLTKTTVYEELRRKVNDICIEMPKYQQSIILEIGYGQTKYGFNLDVYYKCQHHELSQCFQKARDLLIPVDGS